MADEKLVTQTERLKTLADLLERYKGALVKAAPKWFNTDRALMVARLAYSRQPHLLKCDPLSIVACAAFAAQHGLEISGPGGVHPVPFWNRHRNRLEAQPITDYRGLITLARRSGHVSTFEAEVVYKNDRFDYSKGTKPHLLHRPADGERGDMTHAYAISRLKDGAYQFEVWDRAKCEHHRDRFSKAATEGPWVTDFESMAKKTVARALCKWLPMSVEIQQLIAREEKTEAGEEPEDLTAFLGLEWPPENGGAVEKPTGKLGQLTEKLETAQKPGPRGGLVGEGRPGPETPASEASRGSSEAISTTVPPAQPAKEETPMGAGGPAAPGHPGAGAAPASPGESVVALEAAGRRKAILALEERFRLSAPDVAKIRRAGGITDLETASLDSLIRYQETLEGQAKVLDERRRRAGH